MCSRHGHQWLLQFELCKQNCFICLLDLLENANESHLFRESVFVEILNSIVSNNKGQLVFLICNEVILLERVIHTFLTLMVEIDNESLVETVSSTITVLHSVASDRLLEVVAQYCSKICFSAPNLKSCNLITKVLAVTVNTIGVNMVLFLEEEYFSFIINGLENPENNVKVDSLNLIINLMRNNLDHKGNLFVFGALFHKLNFLMSLTENLQVIEKSLDVFEIASKSIDFLEWIYGFKNVDEVNTELEIKKMFTTLKKVFFFREAVINSKCIIILDNLLQKQEFLFVKSFLETNIVEFLYDIIRSTFDCDIIEFVLKIISKLGEHDMFFSSCYAALGIPSVCKALETLMSAKLDFKVILGLKTLGFMLENQSKQASFTNNNSFFDQMFQTVNDAINYGSFEVLVESCLVLKVFQHEKYFPFPLPEEELMRAIEYLDNQFFKHFENFMAEKNVQSQLPQDLSSLSLLLNNVFSFLNFTCLRLISVYGKSFYESKFSDELSNLLTYKWLPNFNACILNQDLDNQVVVEVFKCISTYLSHSNPNLLLYKDLFDFAGSIEMVKLSLKMKTSFSIECDSPFDIYIYTVLFTYFESVDCVSNFKLHDELIRTGVHSIKGYDHEILEYLKEPSLNKELVSIHIVVISLLSLSYFVSKTSALVSPSNIKNALIVFISSELSIKNIPSCFVQFLLFLLGIVFECEQQPKLPSYLVKDLFKDNRLNFLHPLTVKLIVKSPSVYLKSKASLILHCLSCEREDIVEEYVGCFVDVSVSIDGFFLDVVFESIMMAESQKNNRVIFNLIKVLTSVATMTPLSCSFLKNLHNVNGEILKVELVEDQSRFMLACWIDLIRTAVENSIYENDHNIYISKIINGVVSFLKGINVVETNRFELSLVICSVIRLLSSYVLISGSLYQGLDMSVVSSELNMILNIIKVYNQNNSTLNNHDLTSSIYAFLSVIINHSKGFTKDLPSSILTIEISVAELLNDIKSTELSVQVGSFLLWSSLFNCNFENPFLRLTNVKDKSAHELVQTKNLSASVLNQTNLMVLFNYCLRSLANHPQTKSSATKCIRSMILHAKLHLKYAFDYFASSPWLHLVLATQNDPEFDELKVLLNSFELVK